ncbi:hypothetical protein TEA_016139 [Camellia sinensis var. sinensis]|uniref:Uncharacterized protein n=1 Tax=Camellia sinensis var. sinensis TaxID=542762 RepID=A0A4S4DFN9_CAMSN|nr:hypothetical protein TEA_016139 [Camellia sinensis var. sinensis]
MQAVSKGLEKVEQELTASENDGAISAGFQKGRSADSLSQYFGEDPARCPFEQGWLRLETKTSCLDFDLSARAGVLALEREFHPSSISCAVFDARVWDWPLERDCVSAARTGSWKLERETCLQKCWE